MYIVPQPLYPGPLGTWSPGTNKIYPEDFYQLGEPQSVLDFITHNLIAENPEERDALPTEGHCVGQAQCSPPSGSHLSFTGFILLQ